MEDAPQPSVTGTTSDERLLAPPRRDHAQFIDTDPWRVLRIQSEIVHGFDALAGIGPAITLFGSARTVRDSPEYALAVRTAQRLGESGYAIITGGGPGIMQAGNEGARLAGARSVGLNIELPFEQRPNPYCDIALHFRYFFVRKLMLVKYATAFVIFPGGFGTIDELMEALTLIQTGKVRNFPIVLVGTAYWSGLLAWMRTALIHDERIGPKDLDLLTITDDPEDVVRAVSASRQEDPERRRREEIALAGVARAYAPPPAEPY